MARPLCGGGVPFGWCAPRLIEYHKPLPPGTATLPKETPYFESIELTRRLKGPWAPRSQGSRATCTAFAVTAAEELAQALATPARKIEPLSEEFLYHRMRVAYPPSFEVDQDAATYAASSGATFLDQAAQVLETEGVCPRDQLPYDRDPDLQANHVADLSPDQLSALQAAAANRRVVYARNTWSSPDRLGQKVRWQRPLETFSVSQVIYAALAVDIPVAASFMMPYSSSGFGWTSPMANACGRVRYPAIEKLETRTAQDGHAVCITGFIANPEDPSTGWFTFRNSRGRRFGSNPWGDCPSTRPCPPGPGFGVISTWAVDTYCWGYTHRQPPGLPLV